MCLTYRTGLLCQHISLQYWPGVRKVLDPGAISTLLSGQVLSIRGMVHASLHHHVCSRGCHWNCLGLLAYGFFLGQVYTGRTLFQLACILVGERGGHYRHRHCALCSARSAPLVAAAPLLAEVYPASRIHARRFWLCDFGSEVKMDPIDRQIERSNT